MQRLHPLFIYLQTLLYQLTATLDQSSSACLYIIIIIIILITYLAALLYSDTSN